MAVLGRKKKSEDGLASSDVLANFAALNAEFSKDPKNISLEDYEEKFVPFGSIVFDEVLGLKGIPFGGRVIHIHGKEHGGKSTICQHFVKSYIAQTKMPVCIFDFEQTMSKDYFSATGIDPEIRRKYIQVWRSGAGGIEASIKLAIEYIQKGIKLFVFDSIPNMKRKEDLKEIKNGVAMKPSVGEHARDMVKFFNLLLPYAMEHDCVFLMVNQVRARIDGSQEAAMAAKYPSYTNLAYTLPGGNSVRFVPSLMVEVNVQKALKGATDDPFLMEPEADGNISKAPIVNRVKIRILKNKVTMSGYREYPIYLRIGKGLDDWISVRELARHYGLIKNKGARYIVGKEENPIIVYDNKEQAIRDLVIDQNMEILARLREEVVQAIREDNSGSFNTTITDGERFLTGDSEGIEDDIIDTSAFDPEEDDI